MAVKGTDGLQGETLEGTASQKVVQWRPREHTG